jgi:hypothetical protein
MEREGIHIHLSSQHADYYIDGKTSNVGFNLPLIETNVQSQIFISVEHVIIPYSWYDVNEHNNLLSYSINNVAYNLTTAKGNYSATKFAKYLTDSLPSFTVTYDKIKNKFTFTHESSDFTFLSSSTCFKLLGFNKQNNNSFSRTLTSTNGINLLFTPCLCIYSNIDSDSINKSGSLQNKRLFMSVPIEVPPNSMIVHSAPNLKLNSYTNVLSYLEFQLCNIDGQVLDLNGCDWSMTLRLDFIDFVN